MCVWIAPTGCLPLNIPELSPGEELPQPQVGAADPKPSRVGASPAVLGMAHTGDCELPLQPLLGRERASILPLTPPWDVSPKGWVNMGPLHKFLLPE